MNTNVLASAAALSDADLIARLDTLAGREREALTELLAHLASLDQRPSVYAALGYGSLYAYCTQALRFSEDAACARIDVARACRQFPTILDLLSAGEMSLSSVRLLKRHLTATNHRVQFTIGQETRDTSSRMRKGVRRLQGTSRCAAGGTINTRRS
jgi:hypothetical protein